MAQGLVYVCKLCYYGKSLDYAEHKALYESKCLFPSLHRTGVFQSGRRTGMVDTTDRAISGGVACYVRRVCGGQLLLELPIRPLPMRMPAYVTRARLCGSVLRREECRWGDNCTFAHSHGEVRDWNMQLRPKLKPNQQSDQLTKDDAASKEKFAERIEEELDIAVIRLPLNRDNYQRKLHNLLCWEEKHHIEVLEEKCSHNSCKLVLYQNGFVPPWIWPSPRYCRYGFIDKISPDQIAYATQASEAACFVSATRSGIESRADILKADSSFTDERLYIAFNVEQIEILKLLYPGITEGRANLKDVMVQFEVKHLYFDNLSRAVNGVNPEVIAKLNPLSEAEFLPHSQTFSAFMLHPGIREQMLKLDDEGKRNTLKAMVEFDSRSPPILISGSFGTGKTRVLAIGTFCFTELGIKQGIATRVLVCAHHQASVDQLVESYFGPMLMNDCWQCSLIRLTSHNYTVRGNYCQYYTTVSQYCNTLRQVDSHSLVVATTFLTALHLHRFHSPGFFTHILIDEGAQSREPEALAPLGLAVQSTKIVIAGDSCQVGPDLLVLGEEARNNGLKESLLGRLQKKYKELGGRANKYSLILNTNYRCHEKILAVPRDLFYSDQDLVCKAHGSRLHPLAPYPLLFVCSSLNSSGSSAELEAQLLLEQAVRFSQAWPGAWGTFDLRRICVVTASRTQLIATRKLTNTHYKTLKRVRMLPTYDIQGQEFQAVFLSTIEAIIPESGNTSNPTKSPCDRYVFNTVLTRAKSLVVVVGSPLVLLEIEKHMVKLYGDQGRCWSLYISNCVQHDTLIIPPQVEMRLTFQNRFKDCLKKQLGEMCSHLTRAATNQSLPALQLNSRSEYVQPHPPVSKSVPEGSVGYGTRPVNRSRSANSVHRAHLQPMEPKDKVQPENKMSPTTVQSHRLTIVNQQGGAFLKSANSIASDTVIPLKSETNGNPNKRMKPRAKIQKSGSDYGLPCHSQPNSSFGPLRKLEMKHGINTSQKLNSASFRTKAEDLSQASKVNQEVTAENRSPKQDPPPTSESFVPTFRTSHSKNRKKKTEARAFSNEKYEVSFPSLDEASKVKKQVPQVVIQSQATKPELPDAHSASYEKYKDKLDREKLKEELTTDNYKEKFHHLLCWEERTHDDLLKDRCDGLYDVTVYQKGFVPHKVDRGRDGDFVRFGYITCNDGDRLSYAKQASEGSFIILTNGEFVRAKHVFASAPKDANFNAITFELEGSEVAKLLRWNAHTKTTYTFSGIMVNFELKHSYFQRLHDAVDRFPINIVQKILPHKDMFVPFPSRQHSIVYHKEVDCDQYQSMLNLDEGQTRALYVVMNSSSHLPVLVAGPFGTGKTRLLARTAYEVLKDPTSRVLVCAHHQASADTFVASYFGKMAKNHSWNVKFVRVIPYKTYHSKARDQFPGFYKTLRGDSKWDLIGTQLVITTLGIAPALVRKMNPHTAKRGFFTHILIDEGAQTREPETLAPLCFADKFTKIIIAGDHCQVGPQTLVLGKEAREFGLAISLLERLHHEYDQLGDKGRYRSVSLLANHRCHSGILMLPSSLFYKSSLQCQFKPYLAHPFAKYPLQFVCSSFDPSDTNYRHGINGAEAECLIKEVDRWLRKWPVEHSKVCIMSPSDNQCSHIRKVLYRDTYKHLKHVELLKAYDIQGREFRAIFVGTSEVTSDDGESLNPTKSICDPYVFNTAITRSQALVVAVGNPFLLLKSEECMVSKFDERARCWSQYIKRCIELDTFHLPQRTTTGDMHLFENKELLYKLLFRTSFQKNDAIRSDTILEAYRKVFESISEQKRMKLTISCMKKAHIAWNVEEFSDESPSEEELEPAMTQEDYVDEYECELDIISNREAIGLPIDERKQVVKIQNRKNRIGAFDSDTVLVGVFNDQRESRYGRVLKVTERGRVDRKFLCRVSNDDPLVFYPVDNKNPKFINLPRLSERRDFHNVNVQSISEELESKDVVVFDNQSSFDIHNQKLPKIQNVVPLSVAKNMLFIVSFIQWNPKYQSPLGMVIDVLPKGTTAFKAERLLKVQYNVEYNGDNAGLPAVDAVRDETTGPLYDRVFTIDPDDAQNLDDALSLKSLSSDPQVYELGVHIVNVAKHMKPGSEEDKLARQMGTSVYGGKKGERSPSMHSHLHIESDCKSEGKVMHMLSNAETRRKLSLIPNCVRDVISVVTRISIDGELVRLEEPIVKSAQMKSTVQLTYSNAQEIMDGRGVGQRVYPRDGIDKYNSNPEQPSLLKTLQLLYKVACCMKQERLRNPAAYCYTVNQPEDAHCWQTHMLVEELMIWANSTVAASIHRKFADCALLRRQRPPNEEAMRLFVFKNEQILSHSCNLSCLLPSCDEDLEPLPLVIPRNTLVKLRDAISTGNSVLLSSLITSDRYYPQLAAAHSKLRSIYQRAEYCCTDNSKPPVEYRHYSLCLNDYTHFTSPMRRYIDVAVQRIVSRSLVSSGHDDSEEISKEDLKKLCFDLNSKNKNAIHFQNGMANVDLAVMFSSSSEVYDAFVSQVGNGNIELLFPDLELQCLSQRDKKLKVRHIGPFMQQSGDTRDRSCDSHSYCWKIRMTSMMVDQGKRILSNGCLQLSKKNGDVSKLIPSTVHLEVLHSEKCDAPASTLTKQYYSAPLSPSMVLLSPQEWKKALDFVKEPSASKMDDFEAVLPTPPLAIASTTSTGCPSDLKSPFVNWKFKLDLNPNTLLKVWMTWTMQAACIGPAIQMVELIPGVRICVQHNAHPARCFSDRDLSKASRKHYQNIKEYVDLWEKVFLAEAAEKSVKECQPVIIQDVNLVWPNLAIPSNCIDDIYYTTGESNEEKSVVMKLPKHFEDKCSEFFKIRVGYLICARYGTDTHSRTRAVFHMVVHKIDAQSGVVYMKFIGENNCRISKKMKEVLEKHTCELQLISMASSYQRVYDILLQLDSEHTKTRDQKKSSRASRKREISDLVSRVVLGKVEVNRRLGQMTPIAMEVMNKDVQSTTLWSRPDNKNLNGGQRLAMKLVLERKFQLIQGPPGTGKSETGAHIAYTFAMANRQMSPQKCVLYCGPSNKSVDVVLEKLDSFCQRYPEVKLNILRIYSRSVEEKDFRGPGTNQEEPPMTEFTVKEKLKKYAFHVQLRESEEGAKVVEEEEKLRGLPKSKIPDGESCKKYRNLLISAEKEFLSKRRCDIVLCTCNEAAGNRVVYTSPGQCIIDECGMAHEPESLAPISLCEHVALIGDHKQLQPVIDYRPAKDNGLATSLFERYAEKFEGFTETLTLQYRMHEAVCEFPSQHFYDGLLKTDQSVKKRHCHEARLHMFWPQGANCPILFCNVVGEEGQSDTGTHGERRVGIESKFNRKEAEKVIEIIRVLHHVHKVKLEEIAVLTPYSSQREQIKEQMKKQGDLVVTNKYGKVVPTVKVASITESQGDEYGIVILSTVRSQPIPEIANPKHVQADRGWLMENLGFVTDKHQINVGITRSKYGLVIVGNKMLLSYDDTWKELIDHYTGKECVVEGRQFPLVRDVRLLPA